MPLALGSQSWILAAQLLGHLCLMVVVVVVVAGQGRGSLRAASGQGGSAKPVHSNSQEITDESLPSLGLYFLFCKMVMVGPSAFLLAGL